VRARWAHVAVAVAVTAVVAGLLSSRPSAYLDGLGLDLGIAARHLLFGPARPIDELPVAVVAIDEETYRRPPFSDLPRALWSRPIAAVVDGLLDSGVRVVGFDTVFPTSVETLLPGFEAPLLVTLREGGRAGRLVLGKVQHAAKPILPFPALTFAVGGARNLRALNLAEDPDGIVRRVPLLVRVVARDGSQHWEPSMALELATRGRGISPEVSAGGEVRLAGWRVPDAGAASLLVNFQGGVREVPTYSMADVHACAEAGDAAFLRRAFADRVVLIGLVLDVEDRLLTSKRLATGPETTAPGLRCRLDPMPDIHAPGVVRDTVPGVFVHATAVADLMLQAPLRTLPSPWPELATTGLLATVAAVTMVLSPSVAAVATVAGSLLWAGATILALRVDLVLPMLQPVVGAALVLLLLVAFRFAVTDRDKRRLRRAFSLYLPAAEVTRLLDSGRPPALGGETRAATVMFSDIAGFTRIAEGMAPEALVDLLNRYLAAMTEVVERHGGFVDKYIGDAIVAVFGAPGEDPAHARHAVLAALDCQRRLACGSDMVAPGGERLRMRIGINTGAVLVGNIGGARRFNYTVMGDAVNLAARLEGVAKAYGIGILAGGATAEAAGDGLVWRPVDRVRVVGRGEPVDLFEPLGADGAVDDTVHRRAWAYAAALADWQAGRFAAARDAFAALSSDDPAAAAMAARAAIAAGESPQPGWDGVTDLTDK